MKKRNSKRKKPKGGGKKFWRSCVYPKCKKPGFWTNRGNQYACCASHRKMTHKLKQQQREKEAKIISPTLADRIRTFELKYDGKTYALTAETLIQELLRLLMEQNEAKNDISRIRRALEQKMPELVQFELKTGSVVIVKEVFPCKKPSQNASPKASPPVPPDASPQKPKEASPAKTPKPADSTGTKGFRLPSFPLSLSYLMPPRKKD